MEEYENFLNVCIVSVDERKEFAVFLVCFWEEVLLAVGNCYLETSQELIRR